VNTREEGKEGGREYNPIEHTDCGYALASSPCVDLHPLIRHHPSITWSYGHICFRVCFRNADHAFCKIVAQQPTTQPTTAKPAPPKPKLFFCRNSAKHAKAIWKTAQESDSGKDETCREAVQRVKTYWEVFQQEVDSKDGKRLFSKCCDAKRTPPKGKRYTLVKRKIKRKILKAKASVDIDFTDAKNKDKKEKFERVYIKRAQAESGIFAYKKKKSSRRRRLSGATTGTDVTVDLQFASDTAAEAGKTVVIATGFASQVASDLKKEGVQTTLTNTGATLATVEEDVVEEVLADATTAATTTAATTTAAPSKGSTTPALRTSTAPLLSAATHVLASPFVLCVVALVAIA